MKLIILKVGDTQISKYSGQNTQRVTFKPLDEDDRKYYYLNLDRKFKDVDKWLPFMIEGNVLDVQLQGNKRNVNMFQPFQIIKQVTKGQTNARD